MHSVHDRKDIIRYSDKRVLLRDRNNVLRHVEPNFIKETNLLKADRVVVWNDIVSPCNTIVQLAKEHKKKSIVVAHGKDAANDYNPKISDALTGIRGVPLEADEICVWGQHGKDTLMDAGINEDRIHITGSPIIYDITYEYASNGEKISVKYNAGMTVVEPGTKRKWVLSNVYYGIPINNARRIVVFMTYHDFTEPGITYNKKLLEQLKNRPDFYIKTTTNYSNHDEKNPFREWVEKPDEYRCVFTDMQKVQNIELLQRLLLRAKCIVTPISGTINGIAWAMNVPTIVCDIDWGIRKNGKKWINTTKADYVCKLEEVNDMIEEITKKDTKAKQRKEMAEYYMGVSKGNPIQNICEVIDK